MSIRNSRNRRRGPISWQKRHIKDIRGNEYDIWVIYEKVLPFYDKQVCVCHSEEEFENTKKYFGIK